MFIGLCFTFLLRKLSAELKLGCCPNLHKGSPLSIEIQAKAHRYREIAFNLRNNAEPYISVRHLSKGVLQTKMSDTFASSMGSSLKFSLWFF